MRITRNSLDTEFGRSVVAVFDDEGMAVLRRVEG